MSLASELQAAYDSDDFKRFCQVHNLEPSISGRANCWDKALAESFFSRTQKERIQKRIDKTRDVARAFDYIRRSTIDRRQSHLDRFTPEAFDSAAA